MKVSVKGYIYHKDAESFDDCFDRYALSIRNNKFCVSDGVSKSFFPGLWAELLVQAYVGNNNRIRLEENSLFKSIQRKWIEEVFTIVNRPNQKYYVRNFFAQGRSAAATFVGLDFLIENDKPYWEALALGDSFLFFIPKYVKDITSQFSDIVYLSSKKNFEFDNFPDFFDSIDSINKGKVKFVRHELKSGRFFLMTDALSEWFINEKQKAIDEILSWTSQSHFEERISFLRKDIMQNDDTAILIIDVENDGYLDFNYHGIEVSNLSELKGESKEEHFRYEIENEVKKIEEKFEQPILNKTVKEENPPHFISEVSKKRSNKKKKKKGFWESKIRYIKNFISYKDTSLLEDDLKYLSEDIESKDDDSDSPDDINSITDKF